MDGTPMVPVGLRRVLYAISLNPSLKFGSREEQIFLLARAFKQQGSLFLPLFQSPLGAEAQAMYQAAGLEAGWLNLEAFDFKTLCGLMRLIDQHKIELLHWNFYRALNPYIWSLTMLRPRLRHYLSDHNSRDLPIPPPAGGLKRFLKKVMLKRYSKVLSISDFVLQCLKAQGVWSNLCRYTHFINTARFRPNHVVRARVRKEIEAEGRFVVVIIAQLIRAKGVAVAVKALSSLSRRIVLWVIGDGPEAGNLRMLCKELALEPRVRFFDYQVDVSPYMQAADCLVCPSVWGEAAGLVILEGLACGLPVIASAVGGIPEFVVDGRTGLLFPAGDDAQLADRIRRLESDPEICKRMGLEARSVAVERFSPEKRLGEYLELYRAPAHGGKHG
jgi:glycosyltransferase involved in cell wall biosynthesis